MLQRWIEQKLKKSISSVPAVALLGARQIGKTTLALAISQQFESIYLDLESPKDLFKLNNALEFLEFHSDKLIIIDEIQRAPDLFMILRGLIDKNRQRGKQSGQFLLLGSASMDLLRQSSESLAGRIRYLDMSGLNVLEIPIMASQRKQLWLRGGFPESYLAQDNDDAMDWLENLIRTYLERDIPQLGFTVSATVLRRLWTMLAHLQGESINASKLATNLEVKRSNINDYINILTDLLLLRPLQPWFSNVKKRLIKSPRYYVRDSGLLHRLLGINHYDDLLSNPVLGKSWEGFVIENILSVLPLRAESYYYRTAAGAEIDLVLKMPSSEIWAIEIKHGSAPKIGKHFNQTCQDIKADHKFVVYGGEEEFPIGNNVKVISLLKIMQKIVSEQ